jgi:site-specific DNA recombinase
MPIASPVKPIAPVASSTVRAFAYLRVSSEGQVRTDYSDDGLSIDAQREGAEEKAAQLEAQIVREFSDPGRSAYVDLHKRTGFLTMLDELKRRNEHASTRVEYVIVWALNRWARNQRDHWQTRELVRQAGAKLISITEPMIGDDSAAAFLYESMIATQNQFQSMQTSENVKRGLRQKASVGGTYGPAPIGYLNSVDELPDGRRVAIVTIDPDRGPLITFAFQLYASGEYSIAQLAAELERLGLRSRPSAKRVSKPLYKAIVQRVLRNPYYVGKLVYRRGSKDEQVFDGRHEPLIDPETFERVQTLLDEKRVAGERPRVRQHYLRGSVFCGECGNRLTFGISTGKNGRGYPYFFCSGRINGTACTQRANIRPELIEAAIERYYATVQMPPARVKRGKAAIRALAAVSQDALNQVRQAKTTLIVKLEARQDKLLDMRFTEKSISAALFKRKQVQLDDEIRMAQQSLAETDERLTIDRQQIEMALELAEDVQAVYRVAPEQTKRGFNQAFFKKLYILAEWDEDHAETVVHISRADLTPPYALLLTEGLFEQAEAEAQAIKAGSPTRNRAGSDKALSSGPVSIYEQMAEGERFELSVDAQRFFETNDLRLLDARSWGMRASVRASWPNHRVLPHRRSLGARHIGRGAALRARPPGRLGRGRGLDHGRELRARRFARERGRLPRTTTTSRVLGYSRFRNGPILRRAGDVAALQLKSVITAYSASSPSTVTSTAAPPASVVTMGGAVAPDAMSRTAWRTSAVGARPALQRMRFSNDGEQYSLGGISCPCPEKARKDIATAISRSLSSPTRRATACRDI